MLRHIPLRQLRRASARRYHHIPLRRLRRASARRYRHIPLRRLLLASARSIVPQSSTICTAVRRGMIIPAREHTSSP